MVAILSVSYCRAAEPNLKDDLDEVLVQEGLTGVAWSLIGENGEVSIGAAGFRDNPSQTDFTANTRFHVGSLTKSLLATGVLRLVTEGLIELDAPASRYLPDFAFENPWKGLADVTVRHLLDQTIVKGLKPGEIVITSNLDAIGEGAAIRLRGEQAKADGP